MPSSTGRICERARPTLCITRLASKEVSTFAAINARILRRGRWPTTTPSCGVQEDPGGVPVSVTRGWKAACVGSSSVLLAFRAPRGRMLHLQIIPPKDHRSVGHLTCFQLSRRDLQDKDTMKKRQSPRQTAHRSTQKRVLDQESLRLVPPPLYTVSLSSLCEEMRRNLWFSLRETRSKTHAAECMRANRPD